MKAHLLVLHRKESYDGEFGPEIVAVCDEFTMDENPAWWVEETARQKAAVGNNASAWAEVTIEVPTYALMTALYPARTPIPVDAVITDPSD